MTQIRILPLDVELDVAVGETIMGAAVSQGYYWPTTCNGEGRCTTCACEVTQGASALGPRGRSEAATLVLERGERVLETGVRLACQARVASDGRVTVRKAGVRPPP